MRNGSTIIKVLLCAFLLSLNLSAVEAAPIAHFQNGSYSEVSSPSGDYYSYNVQLVADSGYLDYDILVYDVKVFIDKDTPEQTNYTMDRVVPYDPEWYTTEPQEITLPPGNHTYCFRARLIEQATGIQHTIWSSVYSGPDIDAPPPPKAEYQVVITNSDDDLINSVYFKTNADSFYQGPYSINPDGGVFNSNVIEVTPGDYRVTIKWTDPDKGTEDTLTSSWQNVDADDDVDVFYLEIPRYVPSPENQPPQVSVISPGSGDTVNGEVEISVDGYDPEDGALTSISYYIDDALMYTDNSPDAMCPASRWTWDASGYSEGAHTIKVIGYDSQGANGYHQISVTVSGAANQPPIVNIVSPWDNDIFSAKVPVEVEASDPDAGDCITKIEYYMNSTLRYTETNPLSTSSFKSCWNEDFSKSSYSDGASYVLSIKAYDAQGGVTTKSIAVKVDHHPIVVFAPHPDDEILGCGGLLYDSFIKAGENVVVVVLTNGDANELAFNAWKISPGAADQDADGDIDIIDFGYVRQKESQSALAGLGISSIHEIFLGYPDGGLKPILENYWDTAYTAPAQPSGNGCSSSPYNNSYFPGASYKGSVLLDNLKNLLSLYQPEKVYFTHLKDTHADHNVTAQLAYLALKELAEEGNSWAKNAILNNYLVHWGSTTHWPTPNGYYPANTLDPPSPGDVENNNNSSWDWELPTIYSHQLSTAAKYSAIASFQSQMPTSDDADYLYSFARKNELFWPRRLPRPVVTANLSQLVLTGGQTGEVTFTVINQGGPASESYIDVSISPELEVVNRSDWTRVYDVGDKIWKNTDQDSGSLTAVYALCEGSRPSFGVGETVIYKLVVKAKEGASGAAWIKCRVAMNMAGVTVSNYAPDTYVRYPDSGSIKDQQGWYAAEIPVNISDFLLSECKYLIAEEGNDRILIIDDKGNEKWNSAKEDIGLDDPSGGMLAGNFVYIANQTSDEVIRIDLTGNAVDATFSINKPHDVALLSSGNILVCGQYNRQDSKAVAADNKVVEVNPDLSGSATLWYDGSAYPDLLPVRACQNGRGEVLVALHDYSFHGFPNETSDSRIIKISQPQGAIEEIYADAKREISSVSIKSDGNLLVCDYYKGEVLEIDRDGNRVGTWVMGLSYPTFALEISGESVLVVESGRHRVVKIDSPGAAPVPIIHPALNIPVMIYEIKEEQFTNLCITVKNSDTPKAGVEIKRYALAGEYLDSRVSDSKGETWWCGITSGTYDFKLYYDGKYLGEILNQTIQAGRTGFATFAAAMDPASPLTLNAICGPNPFSPNGDGATDITKITYQLSADAMIKIRLVDLSGRIVKAWNFEPGVPLKSSTGYNEIEWDGRDEGGDLVSNGLYLCYILADSGSKVKKAKLQIAVLR